jgi:mRNA interferase MazF
MGKTVKGDVVIVPFPFSDLSNAKRRPALVAASLDGEDIILCQITSSSRTDSYAIPLSSTDFSSGGLPSSGTIRPNKIFTADRAIVVYKAGTLKQTKIQSVKNTLINIFSTDKFT